MTQAVASIEASVEIKIPFEHIDMLELVWHGHYASYFETARCALLEEVGYTYLQMRESGVMYPVVDLHVKYIKPIKFGQTILVSVKLMGYEQLLKLDYAIQDIISDEQLARGSSTQAAVDLNTKELLRNCPAGLGEKIRSAQSKNTGL